MAGKVYLIGAGPGDVELITVKGLRLIRQADVIIYDRLIPPELLDEAKAGAELVNAGKEPTRHRLSQDLINTAIVSRALKGLTVVRLKGGDPFVFGRGSEEALACHEAGISFEIVPGISSSYAVPLYAGIPLTHRGVSSQFTVITGHEDPNKPETSLNYEAIAQTGGTIVVLMGVKQLAEILRKLIDGGLNPDTPAALIEWGTTENQRTVTATVATLATEAEKYQFQSPSTAVIGDVVSLRDAGVAWFEQIQAETVPYLQKAI